MDWSLVPLALGVIFAVASAWFARQAQRAAESADVVEIARTVEKLARQQRSDTMRRVRAAAGTGMEAGPSVGAPFAPPELQQSLDLGHPGNIQELKAQLRRQYLR